MARERSGSENERAHLCQLPWPRHLQATQGHVCECGKRWIYQPAHWEPLLTLDELRIRQEAGAFLRSIVPSFPSEPGAAGGSRRGKPRTGAGRKRAVVVPIQGRRAPPLNRPPSSA